MQTTDQEEILNYFLREIFYLRQQGQAFGQRYPALANRLDFSAQETTDPHVERLIESFAFLTGRVQHKIDREFPEIPAALLNILYPHLAAPIPSMAIARFDANPKEAQKLAEGYAIERETPLYVETEGGHIGRFRTCNQLTLWPLTVQAAKLSPTSAHGPLLWMRLNHIAPDGDVKQLPLDRLRFYLDGRHAPVALLYELLSCNVAAVHLAPVPLPYAGAPQPNLRVASRLPAGSVQMIGFSAEEAVLPHPPQAHPGYRLLQEYFAFPQKFHFFEIANLNLKRLGARFQLHRAFVIDSARNRAPSTDLRHAFRNQGIVLSENASIKAQDDWRGPWKVDDWRIEAEEDEDSMLTVYQDHAVASTAFDIWIVFDKRAHIQIDAVKLEEIGIDRNTIRLGCTPIINLFEQTTEPIRLDQRSSEYHLIPNLRRESTTEIHSIQTVVGVSQHGTVAKPIAPFYSLTHSLERRNHKAFWHARRLQSTNNMIGTSMHLTFVDLNFDPSQPAAQTVYANTLCTNRSLVEQLPSGTPLQHALDAAVGHVRLHTKPSAQQMPPLHGATLWRLVSQLSLNHLSLTADPGALHELLKLHSGSDRSATFDRIEGIASISSRKIIWRMQDDQWVDFVRGLEITLELDEERYWGHSAILIAAVLNHFMPLYVAANSFTKLVVKSKQRQGIWKQWLPITGHQTIL